MSKTRLTPFGGFWFISRLSLLLGVDNVFSAGYEIKRRLRRFSELDYFYTVLALLLSGGKPVSDVERSVSDRCFESMCCDSVAPTSSAIAKFFHSVTDAAVNRFGHNTLNFVDRIFRALKQQGKQLGGVVYAFLDSSEIEVWDDCFEGAGKNFNSDRALRLHTLFLDYFLVGLHLHDVYCRVTKYWDYLLSRFDAISKAITGRIHVLMDAAYYNHQIICYIISRNWVYSVTCKVFTALIDEAEGLAPDRWDGDYAEFAYKPLGFSELQLVAVRR